MRRAQDGDNVQVHYTGTLDDGSQFDSSEGREPLEFLLGAGQVIPGFEAAIVGMAEGETKTVTFSADQAYGPHDPSAVHTVGRDEIPSEIPLSVGGRLQASDPEGNEVTLTITAVDETSVTLDANHPLAGKALTFALTLVGFIT